MGTVIFSDYDSVYRSSALLLRDDVDWGLIDKYMYKEQIPDADEISNYDDEKLFAFFERMFNAEVRRVIIEVDGHVDKIRCKCPRGFFGYETTADGKIQEVD